MSTLGTKLPQDFSIRAPVESDIPAIIDLVVALDLKHYGVGDEYSPDDIRDDWSRLDPQTDAWAVVAPTGQLAAYGTVTDQASGHITADGYVHPEFAGQGIGYPMFTLERLFNGAEILRAVGLDPYGYRGLHKQSLEMAMQYYSCFAQGAGFYKIVTVENSHSCPNAAQYYGKLVNGVDRMVLVGAYRFPENVKITTPDDLRRARTR